MTDVVLFAVIGPNPAPVSEAIWALARQRGVRVVEAHLVALRRGQHYLETELRDALADLHTVLPEVAATVIPYAVPLDDDLDAADAAQYRAAIWDAARACIDRAGARPIVHLLAGGRLRTMTAHSTQVFQLLARPGDELLGVRVSERRAEGGSGFFFPEQAQRYVGELDARAVEVHLVPVPITRLAGVVGAGDRGTFEEAVAASQASIDAITPPQLRIDLGACTAHAGVFDLQLSASQLVYYTALARQRLAEPELDGGWLPAQIEVALPALVPEARTANWRWDIKDQALRWAFRIEGMSKAPSGLLQKDNLSKLRADLKRDLGKRLGELGRPGWRGQLVHQARKARGATHHRLALPAEYIHVVAGT